MRLLFWNIGGRRRAATNLTRRIATAIGQHDVDLVILAESSASPKRFTSPDGRVLLEFPPVAASRVRVFRDLSRLDLEHVEESFDNKARFLSLVQGGQRILLSAAHLTSQLWANPDDIASEVGEFGRDITRIEAETGLKESVVVGDLNMNPYDKGMLDVNGLHALMCPVTLTKAYRTLRGIDRPWFYNPMWSFLGDRSPGPPGSYFYPGGRVTPHWHLYDQILLRPVLADSLQTVKILDEIGGERLVNNSGRPAGSDHLPIFAHLELGEHND